MRNTRAGKTNMPAKSHNIDDEILELEKHGQACLVADSARTWGKIGKYEIVEAEADVVELSNLRI